MEIVKKELNGKNYTFCNEWRNTRNGFKHTTTLFEDERELATATCNYLNRTWECYTYQTSMKKAVATAIERIKKSLEYNWRYYHPQGARFTAKIKTEIFGNNTMIQELEKLYKTL